MAIRSSSYGTATLAHIPLSATGSPTRTPTKEAGRQAPDTAASSATSEYLAMAVRHFENSATACYDAADYIIEDLSAAAAPARNPARERSGARSPRLSAAQHTALQALADEGGKLYDRLGGGRFVVPGKSGTRISLATLEALERRDLVRVIRTTSLFHGQEIEATPAGRQALAAQRPGPVTPAVPAPPSASARPASHR